MHGSYTDIVRHPIKSPNIGGQKEKKWLLIICCQTSCIQKSPIDLSKIFRVFPPKEGCSFENVTFDWVIVIILIAFELRQAYMSFRYYIYLIEMTYYF